MSDELERIREQKLEALRERAAGADTPIGIEDAAHLESVLDRHGVVLLDFYADWCGPCQQLSPVLERIAADTSATVAKVDADAHPDLASRYGVRGLPTMVVAVNGQEAERLVGFQDEARLRASLERVAP